MAEQTIFWLLRIKKSPKHLFYRILLQLETFRLIAKCSKSPTPIARNNRDRLSIFH